MIEPVLEEVKEYVYTQANKEACGLLGIRKGRVKFFPCKNKAEDPKHDFVIDPYDYKAVADEADIVGVIHSHPGQGYPEPSPVDRAACNRLGIPWYIFGGDDEWAKLEPKEESFELLGRPFVFGVYDCYTIVKDYFAKQDIHFRPDWSYEWEFWKQGKNYYLERYAEEGFSKVTDGSLQMHDVILMALNADTTNHAGIYVGKGKMLHHAPYRLSCRDNYHGIWNQITRTILRHRNYQ
jgi:proteasome lid subunit RPN8/RPN11|tara:strand:+ start:8288 stop:8998 length:711 start_codon:yes stop_codon:yes gene_type:complete